MLLQQSAVWLGVLSEWMTSPPGCKLQVSVAVWIRLATASHWLGHWMAACFCMLSIAWSYWSSLCQLATLWHALHGNACCCFFSTKSCMFLASF